jgi:hypothetical protein
LQVIFCLQVLTFLEQSGLVVCCARVEGKHHKQVEASEQNALQNGCGEVSLKEIQSHKPPFHIYKPLLLLLSVTLGQDYATLFFMSEMRKSTPEPIKSVFSEEEKHHYNSKGGREIIVIEYL